MVILSYLYEYAKIRLLTFYGLLFLGAWIALKYLRLPPRLSPKLALLIILLTGLVLRFSWINFSSHRPRMSWTESHQLIENDLINLYAIDLTKGIWFQEEGTRPVARRPIGYPVFLGLLYKIFGVHLSVVWISNLFLFVTATLLIFLLGRQIFSEREGLIAAFLFSLYPTSIYMAKMATDEALFIPVWFLGIYFLFREIRVGREGSPYWLLYSLLFGYATMTRTHTIFMPWVVGLALFLQKRNWGKILGRMVLVALLMQVINLPWIIRNYKLWGSPLIYTGANASLYGHLSSMEGPRGSGTLPRRGERGYSEELFRAVVSGNEALANQIAGREIIRWVRQHPKEFLMNGVAQVLYFMGWDRSSGVWPIWYQYTEGAYDPKRPLSPARRKVLEELAFASYYILLFSFLFSLGFIANRWKSMLPEKRICLLVLGSCLFFWCLEHMMIWPLRKLRFPLEPLMMIVASPFLSYLLYEFRWEQLGRRWSSKINVAQHK